MDTDKKWVLILTGLFFIGGLFTGVFVQRKFIDTSNSVAGISEKHDGPKPDHGERPSPEEIVNIMSRELSLSDTQKEDLKKIFDKYDPRLDALREEFRTEFKNLQSEIDEEVNAILDDEQRKKHEEHMKRAHEDHKDHREP